MSGAWLKQGTNRKCQEKYKERKMEVISQQEHIKLQEIIPKIG